MDTVLMWPGFRTSAKAGEGQRNDDLGDLLEDDPEVMTHQPYQSSRSAAQGRPGWVTPRVHCPRDLWVPEREWTALPDRRGTEGSCTEGTGPRQKIFPISTEKDSADS